MIINKEVFDLVPELRNLSFISDEFYMTGGKSFLNAEGDLVLEHESDDVVFGIACSVSEKRDRFDVEDERVVVMNATTDEDVVEDDEFWEVETPAPAPTVDAAPTPVLAPAPTTRMVASTVVVPEPEDEKNVKIKIAGAFNNEVSNAARVAADTAARIGQLYSEIVRLERSLAISIGGLDGHPAILKVVESMENLRRNEKIDRVYVAKNSATICIVTKGIVTAEPINGYARSVGRMLIHLPINLFVGDSPNVGGVLIFNLTHLILGGDGVVSAQAPHVNSAGKCCFGDSKKLIIDAIASYDVSAAACALIQFLENPNIDDVMGINALQLPRVGE
jgi:hypothetical protein